MLICSGDSEEGEYHKEDEQVIDAERLLDEKAGEVFRRRYAAAVPKINSQVEQEGQRDPEGGPQQGLLDGDYAGLAVEDLHVQEQQSGDDGSEGYPPYDLSRH